MSVEFPLICSEHVVSVRIRNCFKHVKSSMLSVLILLIILFASILLCTVDYTFMLPVSTNKIFMYYTHACFVTICIIYDDSTGPLPYKFSFYIWKTRCRSFSRKSLLRSSDIKDSQTCVIGHLC